MSEQTRLIDTSNSETFQGILVPCHGQEPIPIEGIITLGRDPANDIVVFDPHVSTFHCQVEQRPKGYFVRDLKSRNGVFLNNAKILEAELTDSSLLRVGKLEYTFRLKSPDQKNFDLPISSKNKAWSNHIARLPHIADTQLPVFLQGETGSGKEVVARIIHDFSPRRDGPFIAVNCSALAESLAESELFGHVRGSFTGAAGDRKGAFEAARGGTLFLDEIGDLPLNLQPKLLRALEQQEIKPVGSDKTIKTDARIITATHKDLRHLVVEKIFREDLFFRINVVHFYIPPLRQRREDFEELLYSFAREFRISFNLDAIDILKRHHWSGNIRELKNIVARAKALFPSGVVAAEDLGLLIENPKPAPRTTKTGLLAAPQVGSDFSRQMEKDRLIAALKTTQGNQRKAAQNLGVPKSTLHDRIKTYRINVKSLLNMEGFIENTAHTAPVQDFVNASANVDFKF